MLFDILSRLMLDRELMEGRIRFVLDDSLCSIVEKVQKVFLSLPMVSLLELAANVGTRHVLYLQWTRCDLQLHGFVFDEDWVHSSSQLHTLDPRGPGSTKFSRAFSCDRGVVFFSPSSFFFILDFQHFENLGLKSGNLQCDRIVPNM
jgi:hypothetical protein